MRRSRTVGEFFVGEEERKKRKMMIPKWVKW